MPNLKPTRWISALLSLGVLLMLAGLLFLVVPPNPVNAQPPSTPFPLYSLPDSRLATPVSSNLLALGKDNRTLVAANTFNNSISIITLPDAKLSAEIPVGNDPRSVALTADGLRAVTANRADGTLSVVDLATQQVTTIKLNGVYPYGVVLGADDTAYVSLEGSNAIDVVNLQSATVLQTIPVPAAPAGLALLGDFLYVTHFWSGQISLVYLPDARVVQTSSTGLDTSISQGIELDVTRGIAYLPQTRSNAQNTALTYDSVVFPVVNRVDLHNLQVQRSNRIALDSADRPVNMPFAIALDRFRQWIYVANAGSNDVSVIDLNSGAMRGHIAVG
ncbi:MAG: YncE family protein, partial [Anaerolineae bacterium]|nr:YncE family protein [Anaerolineae bacterium]